jgi:hypothetical protein
LVRLKILVFGNQLVGIDSLPLRLMPQLKEIFPDIEFMEFDPNENLENEGRDLNIIDTVEGIRNVRLITEKDIDLINGQRVFTMHDYDLGYNLKLLKKLNYIDRVRIFGLPMKISEKAALAQLSALIRSTLS